MATYSVELPSVNIIVAIYNSECYLQDFLTSLNWQFKNYRGALRVIFVDDASTDKSKAVVRRWLTRWPTRGELIENTSNRGVSYSRNRALSVADADWVSFADPDDVLSPDYVKNAISAMRRAEESTVVDAIFCKVLIYNERNRTLKNNHPLTYRFEGYRGPLVLSQHPEVIQLGIPVFLRGSTLRKAGLFFDERVRPSFEDGKFIGQYFLSCSSVCVVLSGSSHYIYRKRSDGGSLVQAGWKQLSRFDEQLEFGYLALIRSSVGTELSKWVENVVLYELSWYLDAVKQWPGFILSNPAEFSACLDRLASVVREISLDSLCEFRIRPLNLEAMLALRTRGLNDSIYNSETIKGCSIDGRNQRPVVLGGKQIGYLGVSELRYVERWRSSRTSYRSKYFPTRIKDLDCAVIRLLGLSDYVVGHCSHRLLNFFRRRVLRMCFVLLQYLLSAARSLLLKLTDYRILVLIDRPWSAHDNAEHLYRYMSDSNRHIFKPFFVLKKESKDWDRLAREGVALVPYGTLRAKFLYLASVAVVSSDAIANNMYFIPGRFQRNAKIPPFVFLQHGVALNDLSAWLAPKTVAAVCTSYPGEQLLLGADGAGDRKVIDSGLTRFDRLFRLTQKQQSKRDTQCIAIMPTWRRGLRNALVEQATEQTQTIRSSEFYRQWGGIVRGVQDMADRSGGTIRATFLLHPSFEEFRGAFNEAFGVEFFKLGDIDVQALLVSATEFVTDYSSLAIDAKLAGAAVYFYQPARTRSSRGQAHVYEPDSSSYAALGIGDICEDSETLLCKLYDSQGESRFDENFLESLRRKFDGGACRRVEAALQSLRAEARGKSKSN